MIPLDFTLDLSPVSDGIWDAFSANLPTILPVVGALVGISLVIGFFIRLAHRAA